MGLGKVMSVRTLGDAFRRNHPGAAVQSNLLRMLGLLSLLVAAGPLHAETAAPGKGAAASLRAAISQLQAGQSAAAEAALDRWLTEHSQAAASLRVPALLARARALTQLDRAEEALAPFRHAVQLAPDAGYDADKLRVILAKAAMRAGRPEQTLEALEAISAAASPDAPGDPTDRLLPLRCDALLQLDRLDEAWQQIEPLPTEVTQAFPATIANIAAQGLAEKNIEVAWQAYARLAQSNEPAWQRKAELGQAWAAALGAKPPAEAARRLQAYSEAHPDQPDAVRALRAEASCWRRAGKHAQATAALLRLLEQAGPTHPHFDRETYTAAVEELSADAVAAGSSAVREARHNLVDEAFKAGHMGQLAATTFVEALVDAAIADDQPRWEPLVAASLERPDSDLVVAAALQRLTAEQQDSRAEQLAVAVLDQLTKISEPEEALLPGCVAVCRWCSVTGRWSLMALAAEHAEAAEAEEVAAVLPAETLRLLAEACMQTKRVEAAERWFEAAVVAGADDFPTRIRLAELAVSLRDRATATERLQAAQSVAGQPIEEALVQVLTAELQIRGARFDQARQTLDRIVRVDATPAAVRCRAQWLIGETFLLQNRHREAIDAYRLVESFEQPPGVWTAAALVQAGQAFEKLGQHREAATCYSGLLQRFADTDYALRARDRLAALGEATRRR